MKLTTGILLFNDAEELDFAGPWEVYTMCAMGDPEQRVVTIAQSSEPVRCAKGLRVLADHTLGDAPDLDVIVVPGGQGTRSEVNNPVLIEWLRKAGERCRWITSVCTGSFLLHAAGLARGKRITTHWIALDELRARGDATVVEKVRYVRDGNVVTSAGVSAGIDMSLWVVGQIFGAGHARNVQRFMEYDPAPPYAADV
jgi:transcriptional regulator GlxA family with amidase domain